jgi:hypothetical protein
MVVEFDTSVIVHNNDKVYIYIWTLLNGLRTTTGKSNYQRPASPLRKISLPSLGASCVLSLGTCVLLQVRKARGSLLGPLRIARIFRTLCFTILSL